MSEHQASRTLLKSPPELWAECSDAQSLGRHLDDSFGEIRITRLEPERAVAWEGERVSGTVKLEPSGWGTKVTLTAKAPEPKSAPPLAAEPGRPAAEPKLVAVEPDSVAAKPDPLPTKPPQTPTPEPAPKVDPPPKLEPAPKPIRMGFIGRLKYLFAAPEPTSAPTTERSPKPTAPQPPPTATAPPAPKPDPVPEQIPVKDTPSAAVSEAEAALSAALESLGKAHHRPFSRG